MEVRYMTQLDDRLAISKVNEESWKYAYQGTLPDYIGKGYGSLLLQAVVSELNKMGFDKVFLWVLEENRNAGNSMESVGLCRQSVV